MIDYLKDMVEGILNRTIAGADLFTAHKEILRQLEKLSEDEFDEASRREFALARAGIERLSNLPRHQSLTGSRVISAVERLRPVLDHYRGPKATEALGAAHVNFTTIHGVEHLGDKINIGGNVTGSAVGSNASIKAWGIVTQIQQSALDADLKQKFAEAAESLAMLDVPEGDKDDAADDLIKLKLELEKATKDEGRIRKIWTRIKETAPTVAAILASAVSLGKLLVGSP